MKADLIQRQLFTNYLLMENILRLHNFPTNYVFFLYEVRLDIHIIKTGKSHGDHSVTFSEKQEDMILVKTGSLYHVLPQRFSRGSKSSNSCCFQVMKLFVLCSLTP